MLDFVRYMVVWFPIIMTAMYVMLHVMHLDANGQRSDGGLLVNATTGNATHGNTTLDRAILSNETASRVRRAGVLRMLLLCLGVPRWLCGLAFTTAAQHSEGMRRSLRVSDGRQH